MEELRSTEVLDREILEDARKKAFKILKNADDAVQSQTKRWEKKTQKAIDEVRKSYEAKTEKIKAEILARLPLDKRRLRSETSETFLKNSAETFLKSLPRSDLFRILENDFARRLLDCVPEIAGKNAAFELSYAAMSEDEALSLIKKVAARPELNGAAIPGAADWKLKEEAIHGSGVSAQFPAVVLDIKEARISASIKNAADAMLMDNRAELAVSLLGEGVLND